MTPDNRIGTIFSESVFSYLIKWLTVAFFSKLDFYLTCDALSGIDYKDFFSTTGSYSCSAKVNLLTTSIFGNDTFLLWSGICIYESYSEVSLSLALL